MYDDVVTMLRYLEQFEFIRYLGATGVSGAMFAGIFFPLQWFTAVHYRKSLYIAFAPSLIFGFIMHKYWTFGDTSSTHVWLQMALYTLKRFFFIGVNDYLLRRSVERYGLSSTLGQVLIAVGGLLFNYVFLKVIFSL